MKDQFEQTPETNKPIVATSALLVFAMGGLCLLGWLLGFRALTSMGPVFVTMKPNTAFCLMLIAVALWLSRTPAAREGNSAWVILLTASVGLIAAITLGEYAFSWNAGIDELLFRDLEQAGSSSPPGRLAPGTACALMLISGGIAFVDRFARISQAFTLFTFLLALIGLLGYLYRLPAVSGAGRFTSLALNTVFCFLTISMGLLASRPDRGPMGLLTKSRDHRSQMRALVAGAVILPIILGSAALWGERRGFYGGEFTLVFFSVLLIALTLALVWVTGAEQLALDRRREASENALRESEELARSVIEGSPDGVELLDRTGKVLLTNYQGRKYRQLQEQANSDLVAAAFASAQRGISDTFTIALNEASSEPAWLDVSLTPLRDSGGTVKHVLSSIRDVTKFRKTEEKLAQTAKLESLGVMAGGIAHDFNNLLTGILGNASLLAENPDSEDREIGENIMKAAERAADLTKQMLAYSGKGRFEVRATDLSREVREILPLIKPMIDKDVEVQLNLQEKLPCIEADPGQMHQLVMNLIINGAEAIGGRRGRVTVTTATLEFDEILIAQLFSTTEVAPGRYVCLEVVDSGSGMDEATKAKIFDPFFTTKFTGRGLGLAAVSGIVRGHKAELRVYSSPGEGTTFKVFFPALITDEKDDEPVRASDLKKHQGHGTILLVDDEQIVRQVGKACLERQGYDVILASNGREAVDLFQTLAKEISLVILDMTMPVMSGKEALHLLLKIRSDTPILVCSGYNEVEVIRNLVGQGVAGFIQKPYTFSTLLGTVKLALEKHGATKIVI